MKFLKENRRLILKAVFGLLFIGLAIFFIRHEQAEIQQVRITLSGANSLWIFIGIFLSCIYIIAQGLMYYASFRAIGQKIGLHTTIRVFLKRNFVSVFLPAGGVASLAFFTKEFERKQISRTQIHFASSIYAFTGIISVIIVGIPILSWALISKSLSTNQGYAFIVVILFVIITGLLVYSLLRQGMVYRLILRIWPGIESFIVEIKSITIHKRAYFSTLLTSILIEFIGIITLMIAIKALGFHVLVEAAMIGYITSVLFIIVSPFMRGLGAVELSMAFVLTRFGFSTVDAISITLLYRFFEFWLPLVIGGSSFLFIRNNLFLRIIPAILTFALGSINIISVLTPAVPVRLELIREFIPLYAIDVSNYFVLTMGFFLLVISAFLLKGLRMAWFFALSLSLFSLAGHIIKAIDYEEALLAAFVVISLIYTQRQYFVKNIPRLGQIGITTAIISSLAVVTYGIIGFYFLDKKYFNIDFNILQSIKYTLQNFFLFRSDELVPATRFARDFLYSINIAGVLSVSFLLYTLIRPFVYKSKSDLNEKMMAKELVASFGKSGLDYFKTYFDKLFFFNTTKNAFLAYRVAGNYAIVLENPVSKDLEAMKRIIMEFNRFCNENGLKSFYYRVPEESLKIYEEFNKKFLLFGQEAIVDIENFTIEGGAKKGLRNSCNKARESGFHIKVNTPPVPDGILQKLRTVSDEWLAYTGYKELVFSQGIFDTAELKYHTVLTVENQEEKVAAFTNIIPDPVFDEGTYDLIRKVKEAPNGIIEYLMVELFFYLKSQGYKKVSLGFAPMSGIDKGKDFPEMSIKFAYEKLRTFSHYKGLRDFKEKFAPAWYNRYIIYDNHYDLFNLTSILNKVFKP